MTFAGSVHFLFTLGHELKAMKWGLERTETLLAALGSPQAPGSPEKARRFIHVAGTNGKGSTCAMVESSLRLAGYRTGLYTSPHLVCPTERIKIDGVAISEAVWLAAFERVHGAVERLLASGEMDAHPSFFETVTAMAFVVFADSNVDAVVLEVGLGGRLDATNVVQPALTVITPIDFDHEAFLGSSIASIAGEKAGILKARCPAVFSSQRPDALAVLDARAAELGVSPIHATDFPMRDLRLERYGSAFTLGNLAIRCGLAGGHQAENARTAALALRAFGVHDAAIVEGIAQARWPGRLQRIAEGPDLIVDGAHNPAGARALAAYIQRFFPNEPIRIVFGAMRDKAVEEMTDTLFPLAAEVVLTMPDQPRALHPQTLLENLDHPNVLVTGNLAAAMARVREVPMTTFLTGSLYLVGETLQ